VFNVRLSAIGDPKKCTRPTVCSQPLPSHFSPAFTLAAFFSAAYFCICACSAAHAAGPPGKVASIACMAPEGPLKERCVGVQCFHLKISFSFHERMTGLSSFSPQSLQKAPAGACGVCVAVLYSVEAAPAQEKGRRSGARETGRRGELRRQ
jgi:hypothetical protein